MNTPGPASGRIALNDEWHMPILALGTALLEQKEVGAVIRDAVEVGYRNIDTAYIYGNQKDVGDALSDLMDEGIVNRNELFVTWKLWSTFHQTDLALESCQEAIDDMDLGYFDLCLIHNPMTMQEGHRGVPYEKGDVVFGQSSYMDAWRGLELAVDSGLVNNIGVSNFNPRQIDRIMKEARIQPVVNQVECHPYLNQKSLSDFCKDRGIILSCYGCLGSPGTPAEYINTGRKILEDPVVGRIAREHGRSPAQILLRYQLEREHAVVVKSKTRSRLVENKQCLDFQLSKKDVDDLDRLDSGERHFTFKGMGDKHPEYPFSGV